MIAFILGLILGLLYFGGLYLTTKKLVKVKYPSLLMIISFAFRIGMLLVVFYYVSKGGYKDMLLTLLGVILMRFVIIFTVKKGKLEVNKKR